MWKYKLGAVVRQKIPTLGTGELMFGHVIGFSQAVYDDCSETILVVKWQDSRKQRIHPGNVLLKSGE